MISIYDVVGGVTGAENKFLAIICAWIAANIAVIAGARVFDVSPGIAAYKSGILKTLAAAGTMTPVDDEYGTT